MPTPADLSTLSDAELQQMIAERRARAQRPPTPPDLSQLSDADLEQRIAEAQAARAATPGAASTFAQRFGNATSLGFADELSGGVGAVLRKLEGDTTPFGDAYRQERDFSRGYQARGSEAHPVASAAGTGAGIVASLPLLAKAGAGAGAAALVGGAAGLGNSEADLTRGEMGRAAFDAGLGAGLSAGTAVAVPAAARYLGPKISAAAADLGQRADDFADFALGRSFGVKGRVDLRAAGGKEAVKGLGRRARELGWAGKLSDMLPGGQGRVADRVEASLQGANATIGQSIADATKAGFGATAGDLLSQLDDVARPLVRNRELYGPQLNSLQRLRDLVTRRSSEEGGKLSAEALEEVKRVIGGEVSTWHPNPLQPRADVLPVEKALYGVFKREGEQAVGGLGDDVLEEFINAKRTHGLAQDAKLLLGRAAEFEGTQLGTTGGLQGNIAAAAGMASGGIPGAIGFNAASRLANSPLAQSFAARGLGHAVHALERGAQHPMFGRVLQQAQERGPAAVAATHWLLQQRSPEYRAATVEEDAEEGRY